MLVRDCGGIEPAYQFILYQTEKLERENVKKLALCEELELEYAVLKKKISDREAEETAEIEELKKYYTRLEQENDRLTKSIAAGERKLVKLKAENKRCDALKAEADYYKAETIKIKREIEELKKEEKEDK